MELKPAIRYKKIGNEGWRIDIKEWELMAGDTILRDGIEYRRYFVRKCELLEGDTIHRYGK